MRSLINKIKILFEATIPVASSSELVGFAHTAYIFKKVDISPTELDSSGPCLEKVISYLAVYMGYLLSGTDRSLIEFTSASTDQSIAN